MKQLDKLIREFSIDDANPEGNILEYIERIEEVIKEISIQVKSKNDPNIMNEFNEALKHFRLAYDILENMNV